MSSLLPGQAHASEFIEDLPVGYDTLLGDNGMKISGGQRQRVAMARELYKNARVLIFDEGTSALDTESERIIQGNIDELRDNTTLVLIAHRLSTVRNSDMIFLLDGGRVIEQGTYEYLYALGGRFAAMVDQQALGHDVNHQKTASPLHGRRLLEGDRRTNRNLGSCYPARSALVRTFSNPIRTQDTRNPAPHPRCIADSTSGRIRPADSYRPGGLDRYIEPRIRPDR